MNREQVKELIKERIPCTDYLETAPNYSEHNQTGYCCPFSDCGSGTHGKGSDGAVKYYPETNTWYCHACERGGDTIDAYRAQTGEEYNAALSYLAAEIGETIDNRPAQEPQRAAQGDFLGKKAVNTDEQQNGAEIARNQTADFTEYYRQCARRLREPAAISYLQARGIRPATAAACNIGFDPAADPANVPGATGDEYKPHPTPRIIMPCTKDFYIARSIDPNTPPAFKAPNPKGSRTALFNSKAIYNNAAAVFICEGVFDALSFLEAGQAAIATNGKGNGKLLLEMLQKQPAQTGFIIVPDNDDDPKTAAKTKEQAEELNRNLQAAGYKSIIYNIAGEHHDANDAFIKDRAAFEQRAADAIREINRDDLTTFLEKVQTEAYKPHRTGLNFFDNLLGGGIVQQTLTLLLAAPAAGKTTLAQQIAETIAANQKEIVYFNFEMSREQMLAKAISALYYKRGGNMSTTQILQGYKWTGKQREEIAEVINEYRRTSHPYIKYNPAGISSEIDDLLEYLNSLGKAAKEKGKPAPAAVIDYLHLLRSNDGLDTQELLKKSVEGLKRYAKDYDTFVIGIVAANRDSTKKGVLTMESGRDSSNLEYTADYQISLNYYDIDNGTVKPDDIEKIAELQKAPRRAMILRLLKSRFSQPGEKAQVMFDAAHNIFYGTCDDFIPPAGFIMDDGAPAF